MTIETRGPHVACGGQQLVRLQTVSSVRCTARDKARERQSLAHLLPLLALQDAIQVLYADTGTMPCQ